MKIRSDFVTNSSSSSFIIAKTNRCTEQHIYDGLTVMKSQLARCYKALDLDDSDEQIEKGLQQLAKELFYVSPKIVCGDWRIGTVYFYNNFSNGMSFFMYRHGRDIKAKHFKIG